MPPTSQRTYAVLFAAAAGLDKELASQVALLQALDAVDEIHVWASGQDVEAIRGLVSTSSWEKVAAVNAARATRDATIFDALTAIRPTARDEDLILIADAEHRSLTELTATSCLAVAREQGAALNASQVAGDVLHVSKAGKLAGLPLENLTFLATGPLVAPFSRIFDLYDWAATVAKGSIESAYRWSLARLKPVVLVSTERGRMEPASEIVRRFSGKQ
jgi:2-C-methyl-D-erythritol 4-phosphate cytidylyltransferase